MILLVGIFPNHPVQVGHEAKKSPYFSNISISYDVYRMYRLYRIQGSIRQ